MATKKELFEAVLQSNFSDDLKAVATNCLNGLTKLNATVAKSHKKKITNSHSVPLSLVRAVLTSTPKTIAEIRKELLSGGNNVSTAIISAILRYDMASEVNITQVHIGTRSVRGYTLKTG